MIYSTEDFIISSIIVLIASTIQGTVGFGFSLIAVPLLSLILPIHSIVPMVVCYSLVTNIMVASSVREHINLTNIWRMILFGIIGIPFGVYALKYMDPELLKVAVGVIIFITALIMLKGLRVNFRNQKVSYTIAGFISGVLNGGLSMSGPPIVLFLSNQESDKNTFRGNLTLYATVTNIITVVFFAINGLMTVQMIQLMGFNIVVLLIGSAMGITISKYIRDKQFNQIVLILLCALGAMTFIW